VLGDDRRYRSYEFVLEDPDGSRPVNSRWLETTPGNLSLGRQVRHRGREPLPQGGIGSGAVHPREY